MFEPSRCVGGTRLESQVPHLARSSRKTFLGESSLGFGFAPLSETRRPSLSAIVIVGSGLALATRANLTRLRLRASVAFLACGDLVVEMSYSMMEHAPWGTLDTLRRAAAAASRSRQGFHRLVEEDLGKEQPSCVIPSLPPLFDGGPSDEGQAGNPFDLRAGHARKDAGCGRHAMVQGTNSDLLEPRSVPACCNPTCCRCLLVGAVLVGVGLYVASLAIGTHRLQEAWEGTGVPQMIESHLIFILAVLAAFPYSGTIVMVATAYRFGCSVQGLREAAKEMSDFTQQTLMTFPDPFRVALASIRTWCSNGSRNSSLDTPASASRPHDTV